MLNVLLDTRSQDRRLKILKIIEIQRFILFKTKESNRKSDKNENKVGANKFRLRKNYLGDHGHNHI